MHALVVFAAVPHLYIGAVLTMMSSRFDYLFNGQFSRRKFYLLMGWVPLSFALMGLFDPRYWALFVMFGVAGTLGEVLVSIMWRWFFTEPIWTYSHGAMVGGYTSTLNFLPWAVGGFLFHIAVALKGDPLANSDWLAASISAAVALISTAALVWPAYFILRKQRAFSRGALAVFCAPIATTALALSVLHSPIYLLLMVLFSLVGFVFEYGYGRGMSIFFERSLWSYNHWRVDEGHASVVSVPLWALGGLYFYFLARTVGL